MKKQAGKNWILRVFGGRKRRKQSQPKPKPKFIFNFRFRDLECPLRWEKIGVDVKRFSNCLSPSPCFWSQYRRVCVQIRNLLHTKVCQNRVYLG